MANKRIVKRERKELDIKGIAILIAVAAAAYFLHTYMQTILIGGFLTLIVMIVIVVVGAYFILPAIGATGIAALFGGLGGLIGFGKK